MSHTYVSVPVPMRLSLDENVAEHPFLSSLAHPHIIHDLDEYDHSTTSHEKCCGVKKFDATAFTMSTIFRFFTWCGI